LSNRLSLKQRKMADAVIELAESQTYTEIQKRVDGIAAAFESGDTDGATQLEGLCEVLELTGKVQHSVFSTISNISELTGSNILQTRLLPWLGSGFIAPNAKVTEDTSLQLIKEKVASERKLDETLVATEKTEKSLSLKIASLEAQLAEAKNETTLTQSQLETLKVASETTESELTEKIAGQTATLEAKEKEATAADAAIIASGKEGATLKAQLTESKNETILAKSKLESHKLESSSTLLATEQEILSLRKKLASSKVDLNATQTKLDTLGDYDDQVLGLKREVRLLLAEKNDMLVRINYLEPLYPLYRDYLPSYIRDLSPLRTYRRARSPSPIRAAVALARARSPSPTRANITNDIRANRLITRYSTLFTHDRTAVADTLRRFVDEEEMVRRIICIAATESFHSAKVAYRHFETRTRKLLLPIHSGPETLDEAVADYIVRNLDLYDVDKTVKEVTRQMGTNPIISYPAECDFTLLNSFIREVAKIAFEMQAVSPKINIAYATDGELFNEKKYRRSYDSEYSAPLVAFYIWPALMDGATCVAKGEAYTKRGALLHSPRRSRSPSPRRGRAATRTTRY